MFRTTTPAGTNPVLIRSNIPPQWRPARRVDLCSIPNVPVSPFVEAWAQYAYFGFSDNWWFPDGPADVWRRTLNVNTWQWVTDPQNRSNTANSSDWPSLSTFRVTGWREVTDQGQDALWARFDGEAQSVQLYTGGGRNIWYPHVNLALEQPDVVRLFFTECISPGTYAAKFVRAIHQFDEGETEPYPYYSAEIGLKTESPYCTHRDGARFYGKWSVDFARESLNYRLLYLDPMYRYAVRAVLYQEGGNDVVEAVTLCGSVVAARTIRPGVPETLWVDVPSGLYQDARVELGVNRLQGDCAVLACLDVYQYEGLAGHGGGAQGRRTQPPLTSPSLVVTAVACDAATIKYELPRAARVSLTIFNLAGQAVRALVSPERLPRPAGSYTVTWDGRNGRGQAAPGGIYFCRLQTDLGPLCHKLVLTR